MTKVLTIVDLPLLTPFRKVSWGCWSVGSSDELADATGSPDALLGDLGELLGADDAGHVGDLALAEDLEETLQEIDYYLLKRENLQPW